jgi:hypothetical protein
VAQSLLEQAEEQAGDDHPMRAQIQVRLSMQWASSGR